MVSKGGKKNRVATRLLNKAVRHSPRLAGESAPVFNKNALVMAMARRKKKLVDKKKKEKEMAKKPSVSNVKARSRSSKEATVNEEDRSTLDVQSPPDSQVKRKRSVNFQSEQIDILLKLRFKYNNIIDGNILSGKAGLMKEKRIDMWKKITDAVNRYVSKAEVACKI